MEAAGREDVLVLSILQPAVHSMLHRRFPISRAIPDGGAGGHGMHNFVPCNLHLIAGIAIRPSPDLIL
jgi:hypothetical protein